MVRQFVLTNLGVMRPVDIIYTDDDFDYRIITDYLRLKAVGFVKISEEDAVKLLINDSGIGIGCYVADPMHREDDYRCRLAEFNRRELMRQVGFVRFLKPVELIVPASMRDIHINNDNAHRLTEYDRQKQAISRLETIGPA